LFPGRQACRQLFFSEIDPDRILAGVRVKGGNGMRDDMYINASLLSGRREGGEKDVERARLEGVRVSLVENTEERIQKHVFQSLGGYGRDFFELGVWLV
jgi:hypothetical protein